MLHEQPGQERHAEGLDQPVDEQRHHQPLGLSGDAAKRAEIHLQHHRVDHQPDQHGDRDVDLGPWPNSILLSAEVRPGARLAQIDAGDHAEEDPERQVALEKARRFGQRWRVQQRRRQLLWPSRSCGQHRPDRLRP